MKLRILERNDGCFLVEIKQKLFFNLFSTWNYFGMYNDLASAQESVENYKNIINEQKEREKSEKIKRIVEVIKL